MVVKLNTVRLNGASLNSASLNGVGDRLRASAGGGGGEVIPPEEPDVPDVPVTYTLSASASNGVVSASVNGKAVTLPVTANEGDVVVVEVTANDGYVFEGWSDGSTDNPRTITMHSDVTLSATCVVKAVEKEYIQFEDAEVERVLMSKGVSSDGVGITKEDAAAVTGIGEWFYNNTVISFFNEFTYFTGVTSLGYRAFQGCTSLQEITLPVECTNLEDGSVNYGTFRGCTSLRKVVANGLTSLGYGAFQNCSALSDISIAWANVTKVNTNAFNGCTALSFDYLNLVSLETLGINALNGVKIKKLNLGKVTSLPDGHNAINYGDKSVLEEIVLPEGITTIPRYSFQSYTNLKKCVIPKSVVTINQGAFDGATQFEGDVDLPNLTKLGQRAFTNTKISSFSAPLLATLPSQLNGLGTFTNCSNLTSINIPLVSIIYSLSFRNCSISGALTLNATEIQDGAFYGNEIEELYLPAIVSLIGTSNMAGSFAMNTKLRLVDMGATVAKMSRNEFYGCASLATFICRATTPPTLSYAISNIFEGTPIASGEGAIYVPDASVEAYKTATNWNTYADRIHPLSEIEGSLVFYDKLVGDGTAYINTEYYPTSWDNVEWDADAPSVYNKSIFGCRSSALSVSNLVYSATQTYYHFKISGSTLINEDNTKRQRRILRIVDNGDGSYKREVADLDSGVVNAIQANWSASDVVATNALRVFCSVIATGANEKFYKGAIRSLVITDAKTDNTKMSLKPCTYYGEAGMWDEVNGKFYGNAATSGEFSVAND